MTELKIEGYASLFDQPDLSGDIVQKGAFAQSLLRYGPAQIACLHAHGDDDVIGTWNEVYEDQTGLFVRGLLKGASPIAQRARAAIQKGHLNGLSIGFQTKKSRRRTSNIGRVLIEIDLWEVSLVTFPMQPLARVQLIEDQGPNKAPHIWQNAARL
jgi:uncharacterized protein